MYSNIFFFRNLLNLYCLNLYKKLNFFKKKISLKNAAFLPVFLNQTKPDTDLSGEKRLKRFSYVELDKQQAMDDLINYGSRNFSSKNI